MQRTWRLTSPATSQTGVASSIVSIVRILRIGLRRGVNRRVMLAHRTQCIAHFPCGDHTCQLISKVRVPSKNGKLLATRERKCFQRGPTAWANTFFVSCFARRCLRLLPLSRSRSESARPPPIFSVLNGILLKPLPYSEPDRLAGVWHTVSGLDLKEVEICPSMYFTYREL